jgi:capsular exopolysaccharide synthesis family protein
MLAQQGQRVLLVDADMRRPMLHRYVGAANQEGLSSLLTDASLSLEHALVAVQPGLDLLPAGPMPPDATRLLSSERCGVLVDQIRALPGYDVVLFDTPSALLLSDPVLLASHLDGLLFVVGMERVNRDLPAQALERMRDTGTDVLGLLANLASRSSRRRGRGYGYGYGRYGSSRYGYGYGGYGGYGGYAGYGGYEELASRYQSPVDSAASNGADRSAANGSAGPAPRTISRQRSSRIRRGLRSMVKWLDRRD